jgi:hypothetical protein
MRQDSVISRKAIVYYMYKRSLQFINHVTAPRSSVSSPSARLRKALHPPTNKVSNRESGSFYDYRKAGILPAYSELPPRKGNEKLKANAINTQ